MTATLEVACRPARQQGAGTGVQLASVWIEAAGAERVDSSWVAAGYAANVPVAARQGRHLLRHLFHVHSRPVLQHALLTPGFAQRFTFRFRLPEGLPPSFKGTAVKYSYHLEAHARFSTAAVVSQHQRQPSSSSVGSDTAQANGRLPPGAEGHRKLQRGQRQLQQQTARATLNIWPKAEPAERRAGSGSASAADEAQPPPALRYDVPASDLAVELKAAPADDPAAEQVSPGGAARLMHAASQPAMLDGLRSSGGAASPLAGGSGEAGGARTSRRMSSADTPSHAAEPPPALRSYNLRMGDAPLVRVAVHQPPEGPLQRGVPLAGTLDFRAGREAAATGSAPQCTEVLVLLETEEAVAPRWQPAPRPGGGVIRKVWDEWSELTPDTVLTHFLFSIPLDAPPSFATPAAQLRWLLRFRFTAQAAAPASGGGWGLRLGGGGAPAPEQITWTLPLTVRAPGSTGT